MSIEVVKKFSEDEAAAGRLNVLETNICPVILKVFEKFPKLNSAVLMIRHNDQGEIKDAIQAQLAFSLETNPNLQRWYDDYEIDRDRNFKGRELFVEGRAGALTADIPFDADGISAVQKIVQENLEWDQDDLAISLFSSFCPGADNIDLIVVDNFIPFAILSRGIDGSDLDIGIAGSMYRPWLDGVMPLAEQEEQQLPQAAAYRQSLETSLWKQISKIPGGLLVEVQDYFDDLIGPEPEPEPDIPMTEFEALKMVLGLMFFILFCMVVLSLLGLY